MRKMNRKKLASVIIGLVLLLGMGLFFTGTSAKAEDTKKKETVQYNLNMSFTDNLSTFAGKRVNITPKSGQVISGKVKQVKNNMLHLEKITQRNYYDALIKTDEIAAMDAQFRGF